VAEALDLLDPALSPDGRRVAASRSVLGNGDVWLFDGARMSRVTFDAMDDSVPVWSPDGAQIVFRSTRTGQMDIYQKAASGAGVEAPVVITGQAKAATSWSADGRFVLYMSNDPRPCPISG
jgi:TolB protein